LEGQDVTEESTTSAMSRTIAAEHDDHDENQALGRLLTAVQPAPAEPAEADARDEVTIRLPADGAYLSVLRTATAGLAARLHFTLDEIEDLRIAVDEA